jgi:hypothetical protein
VDIFQGRCEVNPCPFVFLRLNVGRCGNDVKTYNHLK